jgi:predicted pyridoxine 5'-phosphate oxidase superfamily flavin-nucleotide-binding protein
MVTLTADMRRVVEEQRLGFVATVCPDGTPNLSPKGTVAVWDDQHLAFADIRSPQTVANLEHRPVVEINVVDQLLRKGYRFKGQARVYRDGELLDRARDFYQARGVRSQFDAVVVVDVETASPIDSPAYDWGETEATLREIYLEKWLTLWGLSPVR